MECQFILKVLFPFISIVCSLPQNSNRIANSDPLSPAKCSSYESLGYNCVPYYQCNRKGHIITDGYSLFDIRLGEAVPVPPHKVALGSTCDGLLEVCCLLAGEDGGKQNPRVFPPSQPLCGRHNDAVFDLRDGDLAKNDTKFAEWPHVCAVLVAVPIEDTEEEVPVYQCAGSIISKGVILTAAHCVHNSVNDSDIRLVVRCGEWDTSTVDEPKKHQERYVETIIIHPDFNDRNLRNNFALLITEKDFIFDVHIYPVCLPSPGDMFKPQECVANGWGKNKFGSDGRYQTRLKEVALKLVDHEECEKKLRETRLGRFFQLDDSFICAGGEKGIDTCKGDGGGPLTCRHEESGPWVQAGIISWGIGCGQENTPAVYARISKAVCWIDRVIRCYFDKKQSFFGFKPEECSNDNTIENCSITDFVNPRSSNVNDPEDDIFGYDY